MGITDTCSKNPKKLKQKTPSEYCYKHRFMECQILIIQIRFDDLIHYLIINLYANEIICALIHLMLTVNLVVTIIEFLRASKYYINTHVHVFIWRYL